MVSPAWRDELRSDLQRQGLPPSYIERLVEELCDHFDDVVEQSEGIDAEKVTLALERVGQPSILVASAVTEYHKREIRKEKIMWKNGLFWELKWMSVEACCVGGGLLLNQFTEQGAWFLFLFICVDLLIRFRHYSNPSVYTAKPERA